MESSVEGYDDALKSVRAAKGFWSLLIVLAILVHVTAFVLVEFAGLAPAEGAPGGKRPPATRPATRPAAKPSATATPKAAAKPTTAPATRPAADEPPAEKPGETPAGLMEHVRNVLAEALPIARLAAPLSAAVLAVTLFLALMIVLSGRLGGAKSLVGALLWSIVLGGVLVPWKDLVPSLPLLGALPQGGLTAIREGKTAGAAGTETAHLLLYYLRYAAYPVLALLLWMTVQVKFARGYRSVLDGAVGVDRRTMP